MLKLLLIPIVFSLSACVEKKLQLTEEELSAPDSCVVAFITKNSIGVDISTDFSVDNIPLETVDYVSTCNFDLQLSESYENITRQSDQLIISIGEGSERYPLEINKIPLSGFDAKLFEGCDLSYRAEGELVSSSNDLYMERYFYYIGPTCQQSSDSQAVSAAGAFRVQ